MKRTPCVPVLLCPFLWPEALFLFFEKLPFALHEIQIADGSKYLAMTQSTHTATQDIEAARGKIADSTGKILNTNELNCSVKLQKASLESGTENEVIYRILTILMKHRSRICSV